MPTIGELEKIPRIEAFHVTATYGGCLEGPPPVTSLVKSAERRARDMWGERPTLVLQPSVYLPEQSKPAFKHEIIRLIPKWQFSVWLNRPAMNKKHDGSHLVLIWWAKEFVFDLSEQLASFKWEDHAKDWDV